MVVYHQNTQEHDMSIQPNMYAQRNKHIRDIKSFLMSEIFHAYNNEKEIELEHILLKNHKALNLHGILPSFMYKKNFILYAEPNNTLIVIK